MTRRARGLFVGHALALMTVGCSDFSALEPELSSPLALVNAKINTLTVRFPEFVEQKRYAFAGRREGRTCRVKRSLTGEPYVHGTAEIDRLVDGKNCVFVRFVGIYTHPPARLGRTVYDEVMRSVTPRTKASAARDKSVMGRTTRPRFGLVSLTPASMDADGVVFQELIYVPNDSTRWNVGNTARMEWAESDLCVSAGDTSLLQSNGGGWTVPFKDSDVIHECSEVMVWAESKHESTTWCLNLGLIWFVDNSAYRYFGGPNFFPDWDVIVAEECEGEYDFTWRQCPGGMGYPPL